MTIPTQTSLSATPVAAVVVPAPKAPVQLRRVLHLINGEHFSGAERVQQLLGKQLGNYGYDARFACLKPGKFREFSELREHQVCDFPMSSRIDMGVIRDLATYVESESIELLHAHTPRTAMVTSRLAYRTGIPWVYHVHSPTSKDSTRSILNRINGLVETYAIRNCDMLLTVSRSLRRTMLKAGCDRQKMAVVANGVPAIEPIDPRSRLKRKSWRLGLIALMRPRKGVEVALEAMQQLKERDLPIQLELIGGFETPEYEQHILDLERELDVGDCVERTGFTNQIPDKIRSLDALLLPSLFGEGMPMVVLEAIAAGIPVIATHVEGTPEVIRHQQEGLLAEPGSAHSLAAMIQELTFDREIWAKYSENALARHRAAFSDEVMAQRVAKHYDRVLSHRP